MSNLADEYRREVKYRLTYKGSGSGSYVPYLTDMAEDDRFNAPRIVAKKITTHLDEYDAGQWSGSDDELFGEFRSYVEACISRGDHGDPILLWKDELEERIQESKTKALQEGKRLHIGAPMYNLALCYFANGDFETAYQWFAQAGEEDEQRDGTSRFKILIGDHVHSADMIIEPIIIWTDYFPEFNSLYSSIVGTDYSEVELTSLANSALIEPEDAVHFYSCMHRFIKTYSGPQNAAASNVRIRAVGDMALCIESCLRKHDPTGSGQLYERLKMHLGKIGHGLTTFNQTHDSFNARFSKLDRDTAIALNWITVELLGGIEASRSPEETLGLSSYLVYRLRNSLLHVVDRDVCFFNDEQVCSKLAGVCNGVLRVFFN